MAALTPMMQQYMQIKEQHKDAILFFRLGDFYEMFFEDAILVSRELEITLTGRECGLEERAPMCGVPFHAADGYIARLIEKGYKVAICEQTQDPEEAKGLVERKVVRIITPGTVIESSILDDKTNNYLISLFRDSNAYGLSGVDVSTGEFFISEITAGDIQYKVMNELARIQPSEILVNESLQLDSDFLHLIRSRFSSYITPWQEWAYQKSNAYRMLLEHFKIQTLEPFGCENMTYGICAAGALLAYLSETQKNALSHINFIKTLSDKSYMILDDAARRNLELTETLRSKSRKGSLLWILDKTETAMGGRLLRRWIQQPLILKKDIEDRLDAVQELMENSIKSEEIKELLQYLYDLERLAGRIAFGSANARDLLSLKQSLQVLPALKEALTGFRSGLLSKFHYELDTLDDIFELLDQSIFEDPPASLSEGSLIKSGWNKELDQYRQAITDGKTWIASLEKEERDKTGIKTLKIGFNKVFGYYIDVTKSYYDLVPETYIRKQTLANSERYITPELKKVEDKVLGAEDKSIRLEYRLFVEIREQIGKQINRIQAAAAILAQLDALLSFARVSYENNYTRPIIREDGVLDIKDGRHPVVEKTMAYGLFISNNTNMKTGADHLMIITGPNMAGKSTYLRQVALIVLMAQIGCFVPAGKAQIGIVDRIFTRVGASDDLASGQSTFMVEMSEVANILHNATSDSLLVLDEIGRGTSTLDGLSIAYAVVEYICQTPGLRAKTLFATHYHELTELEGKLQGVKNYCIAVKEQGDDIIFLRRIIRGGADKSFGIQVAKLAGLPEQVIERAKEILKKLEDSDINKLKFKMDRSLQSNEYLIQQQMDMFDTRPLEIMKELQELDVDVITPIEAIGILHKLVQKAQE
ncbi:MAG TPA: DNA mismatch repair protein MutS [Clostridiales bacterium]|nr:DNA mismatch repair protein MutS [Clostridiales bacterium]